MPLIITPGYLKKRAEFYQQLSSFTRAGVGVVQGLQVMVQRPPAASYRKPIQEILAGLGTGLTFSECLGRLNNWVPEFDLALFTAAERSGRLDEALRVLGQYYEERAKLASEAISSLMYPVFLVHMAGIIFPTRLLANVVWKGETAAFAQQKLTFFVPLYLAVFGGIFLLQKSGAGPLKSLLERVMGLVPLLGSARRDLAISRFALAFEAMLNAGVPIIEAMASSASASGSIRLERAIHASLPALKMGDTPAEVISRIRFFPDIFASSFKAGELSGQLDTTMKRMNVMYQEQASLKAKAFAEWVPRLIYLCVAIAVGYFIVSFWTNYFGNLGAGF